MPIAATDMLFYYSTTAGSAGNSTAGTAAGSLGKYCSTTPVATGAGAMFDDITGAENAASTVDYRCFFLRNDHATLTATSVTVYMSEVAGGASCSIALDNIATSAKGSASAQAATIATETTAPTGVGTFSAPTTDAAGLVVGSLAPGQVKAVWVRRAAANTAALTGDGVTLYAAFDTPA